MKDSSKLESKAKKWFRAWNKKDLEFLLSHYSDDIKFYSPLVKERWKKENLSGKDELRKHFSKSFENGMHCKFELVSILPGIDGAAIIYKKAGREWAVNTIEFDEFGKVRTVHVFGNILVNPKKFSLKRSSSLFLIN